MSQPPDKNRKPKSLSPTPLRDWVCQQTRLRRAGMVFLFAVMIACGGSAAFRLALTPVPFTQQLLFVLLAGVLLGSRLGAVSAMTYLVVCAVTGWFWPQGAGPTPLTGLLAGYLWSLPLVAYLSGWFVEHYRTEKAVVFGMGVAAGVAVYDAFGAIRLPSALDVDAFEAVVKGAGVFVGQHLAQGGLAIFIGTSTSTLIQAHQKK